VRSGDCELSKVSITACLTVRLSVEMGYHHLTPSPRNLSLFSLKLLWQYGDRHYQASRWDIAVDWFLGGTHQLFRGFNEGTMKCYRKAALCYIQQREYASAAAVVRLCPGNEAATHYISLLTSVKQGICLYIIFSTPHANGFIVCFMVQIETDPGCRFPQGWKTMVCVRLPPGWVRTEF